MFHCSKLNEYFVSTKYNFMEEYTSMDATPQRPEGARLVDGFLTEIDISRHIDILKAESTWKESDRNSITLHKSDKLVIVLIGLHHNARLKPHLAPGILSLQVLEGSIDFSAENKLVAVGKGQAVVLHEKIMHSVVATKETFLLLTICTTG